MKRSANRILTTHVGSLARPDELLEIMRAKESGSEYDASDFQLKVQYAVNDVVARQLEAGIDVICDGEQGKSGFLTYVSERLGGFTAREQEGEDLWKESRETLAFPEFYQAHRHYRTGIVAKLRATNLYGPNYLLGSRLTPAGHRERQSGDKGCRRRRGLHDGHLALRHRRPASERIL